MPYKKKMFVRPPLKCRHGRKAVIYWNGREIYLGPWNGSPDEIPTAVLQRYTRTCQELEEQFVAQQLGVSIPEPADDEILSISEAILAYLQHLEHDPDGYRRPDGSLSGHFQQVVRAMAPLNALFGEMPAPQFGARELEVLRTAMVNGSWRTTPKKYRPWGRDYVNRQVARVIRIFRWCERKGFVGPGRAEHLRTVSPLRRGLSAAHESNQSRILVPLETIETLAGYTSPQVAAMMLIQRLTAARPGEVCRMRGTDIDRSGDVWIYEPDKHKTKHHGKSRRIFLGRRCQETLLPFLVRPPAVPLFSPNEADAWWREHRPPRMRKTVCFPCEQERVAEKKAATRKRLGARLTNRYGDQYTSGSYRQAIRYAIRRANQDGHSIPDFTPYDLRHSRLTEIEEAHSLEDAAAVGGHSLDVARVYTHRRDERARRLAEGD